MDNRGWPPGDDRATFQRASVYAIPFDDGRFDFVHELRMMYLLTDPLAALKEMLRVSRGMVFTTMYSVDQGRPAFHGIYDELPPDADGVPRPGPLCRSTGIAPIHRHLFRKERRYAVGKVRCYYPGHDELKTAIKQTSVPVLYWDSRPGMSHDISSEDADSGPVTERDRVSPTRIMTHSLIFAARS